MNGFPRAKKHGSSKFACAPSAGSVPHRYRRPSASVLQPPAARHAVSEQASGEVKSKPPQAREVLVRHICADFRESPLDRHNFGSGGLLACRLQTKAALLIPRSAAAACHGCRLFDRRIDLPCRHAPAFNADQIPQQTIQRPQVAFMSSKSAGDANSVANRTAALILNLAEARITSSAARRRRAGHPYSKPREPNCNTICVRSTEKMMSAM